MSLTIKLATGGAVTVGGEFDDGGDRGKVTLAVPRKTEQLTPAQARTIARKLVQFADQARPPRK
jgi:hypothetical protein